MFKSKTQNVNFIYTKCLKLDKDTNYLHSIKAGISKL